MYNDPQSWETPKGLNELVFIISVLFSFCLSLLNFYLVDLTAAIQIVKETGAMVIHVIYKITVITKLHDKMAALENLMHE